MATKRGGFMGTQQGRQGRDRQGSRQQGDGRPQQERDLQRNKQSDRGRQPRQGGQNVYGEGNYAASRQYNDATKDFAQSGRVEEAARAAAPRSEADARQMQAAEAEGKRHAKGEDPALGRRSAQAPQTPAPRPGKEDA
jgi:hypothetical protein